MIFHHSTLKPSLYSNMIKIDNIHIMPKLYYLEKIISDYIYKNSKFKYFNDNPTKWGD